MFVRMLASLQANFLWNKLSSSVAQEFFVEPSQSALAIITSQCQQLAIYLSAFLGIFLVQCRKALRVLLPELLIDMRSEKHALLIILHRRPFGLVTRPEKRGFHPKGLRYLPNECRHFLCHLAIERGPLLLTLPLQACLFLLQGIALLD